MDLSHQIDNQKELLKVQHKKFREGNMNEDGYNNRLKQVNFEKRRLEYFNDEANILTNEFYFLVYGNDKEEFRLLYDDIFSRFAQIKVSPQHCSDDEIKYLFYHMYNPVGQKTLNDFSDNANYINDILPDVMEINSKRIKTESVTAGKMEKYRSDESQTGLSSGKISRVRSF